MSPQKHPVKRGPTRACRGARRLGARVSDTRDGEMCAALALHITELVPRNAGGCSACCDVRPACFITAEFACARAAGGSDAGDRRFWLRVAAVCNWWGPSARGALFVQPARDARGAASADSDGGMFPSRSFPGACACFKAGGCRELQPDEYGSWVWGRCKRQPTLSRSRRRLATRRQRTARPLSR